MYLSQIIMLCILSLYSAVCQLYLSKTGRKKETYQKCHCIFWRDCSLCYLVTNVKNVSWNLVSGETFSLPKTSMLLCINDNLSSLLYLNY